MKHQDCKIVFFDIDGTLLNSNHEVPESTKRAVRALQDRGIETVIATGRTPMNYGHIREQLGIHSYISLNGNYVVREGEVLSSVTIETSVMEQLNVLTKQCGHAIGWVGTEQIGLHNDHPMVRPLLEQYKMDLPLINSNFYLEHDIYQGMLFCPEDEIQPYLDSDIDLQFIRFDPYLCDVIHRSSNKFAGISHYLKAAGIEADQCMAFGDGLNDIEMLQGVGFGVAMGQAKAEVKQAASYITRSVDEDGIETALRELGIISS